MNTRDNFDSIRLLDDNLVTMHTPEPALYELVSRHDKWAVLLTISTLPVRISEVAVVEVVSVRQ